MSAEDTELETTPDEEPDLETEGLTPVNVRNFSIKCGKCNSYQTLAHFRRRDKNWNVYTYECESGVCDPEATRTYVEVPIALDEFANRDPTWRGGKVHAGADHPD